MILTLNDLLPNSFQTLKEKIQDKFSTLNFKISKVSLKTLLELGTAIAIHTTIITFFAVPLGTPLSMLILGHALWVSIIPLIILVSWNFFHHQEDSNHILSGLSQISRASLTNDIGLAGIVPLIHELGHACAARACFKNPKININIKPYQNGATSYYINQLTKLGSYLGKNNSLLLATSAGIISSTLFGMLEIGLAELMKERYPTLSQILNCHAFVQIFNDIIYGFTAFITSKSDLSHDFIRLWTTGGIHPLIPISLMISLPLLEMVFINCIQKQLTKKDQKTI